MGDRSADHGPLAGLAPLAVEVAIKLLDRGQTVAFAESCTGGRVSAMLSAYPGISAAFLGSVVGYANSAKQEFLGVSQRSLRQAGAVSREVALEMAHGARARFGADWVVSITGIAGPGGGTKDKPVGLVLFGIVGPGVEDAVERRFSGERLEIQQAASDHALSWLSLHLGEAKDV